MADNSKIEWTDASWNPIRARVGERIGWHCESLTPGCERCYAEAINHRLGTGDDYLKKSRRAEIFLDEKILAQPLHWRRPRRIFVCSMSDLFGKWASDEMIDRVFAIMALAPQHFYQVLTKRADRMREYLTCPVRGPWAGRAKAVGDDGIERDMTDVRFRMFSVLPEMFPKVPGEALNRACRWQDEHYPEGDGFIREWPLPHVWLGVSVEDQRRADERIPLLLDTPAAVRWVSAEPLLGEIDLRNVRPNDLRGAALRLDALTGRDYHEDDRNMWTVASSRLDWVVCGGESGLGARPMDLDWARSLVAQCRDAGVPCFVKQMGANPYWYSAPGITKPLHLRDRKGGDPAEWPEDLMMREYPATDIRVRSPACRG